jgi:hypothetical protein
MQQGKEPASLCQIRHTLWLYPYSITGVPELDYLLMGEETSPLHVRPFNSEGHSTSALLPRFQNFRSALW